MSALNSAVIPTGGRYPHVPELIPDCIRVTVARSLCGPFLIGRSVAGESEWEGAVIPVQSHSALLSVCSSCVCSSVQLFCDWHSGNMHASLSPPEFMETRAYSTLQLIAAVLHSQQK